MEKPDPLSTHTHTSKYWARRQEKRSFKLEMIVSDGKYTHTVEQQLLRYMSPSIIKRDRELQLLLIEPQQRCGMFIS